MSLKSRGVVICFISVFATCICRAQPVEPLKAELVIRVDQPGGVVNKNIYGHFAEHLGRCIYDGIWVGENSPIPNTRGMRNDIIAALKNMAIPVLRWPGGCFADEYHWRDGIGTKEQRPKRINTSWGGVIETNAFGTHEFMDLCEMIGADAYVGGNVGTGTPQEMMEWIEYITSDSDSALAAERKKNGREKPWKLPFFAVGNESWGCGGNMTAEEYANEFRRFATFVKSYSGNRIQKIACGPGDVNYEWMETVVSRAVGQMQGISLHNYTLPTGSWRGSKGSATQFGEQEWHTTLRRTLIMDELIQKHGAIIDKYDPQKRISLVVDEWGTWYDTVPGASALFQQNTIRDALVAGVNLNIFNQHCDRVKMANIAQTINVLQAVILTEGQKMVLTPTYHVFEMYKLHQGATLIPVQPNVPAYTMGSESIPSLNASASRDSAGRVHLSIVNLDANRSVQVSAKMTGLTAKNVSGRVLTTPQINSMNTFDNADAVKPAPFTGAQIQGGQLTFTLPARSVTVLEIQ